MGLADWLADCLASRSQPGIIVKAFFSTYFFTYLTCNHSNTYQRSRQLEEMHLINVEFFSINQMEYPVGKIEKNLRKGKVRL